MMIGLVLAHTDGRKRAQLARSAQTLLIYKFQLGTNYQDLDFWLPLCSLTFILENQGKQIDPNLDIKVPTARTGN